MAPDGNSIQFGDGGTATYDADGNRLTIIGDFDANDSADTLTAGGALFAAASKTEAEQESRTMSTVGMLLTFVPLMALMFLLLAVLEASGKTNPSTRDFVQMSGRGRLAHPTVGGPTELADHFEEWFTAGACDGFVIGGTHMPGAFEDFVELVVPELQRRGLFRTEYETSTLRGHLGIDLPERGAWKR